MNDVTPAIRLRDLMMGFIDARLVYVAAELGIADLLKDGPRSSHDLAEHPEDADIFDQAMAGGSSRSLDTLLSVFDFSKLRSVVDVGGGNGAVLTALVHANPQLHGTVFDLPHLQVDAERSFAAAGLADRCRFEAGSFFETVTEGADAYVLKSILHDWDDAQCITILRCCRRAMAPGGRVLVVDLVLPDGNQPALNAVRLDLTMLALLKGRERTEAEFRELFMQADLQLVQTLPLPGGLNVLEAAQQ